MTAWFNSRYTLTRQSNSLRQSIVRRLPPGVQVHLVVWEDDFDAHVWSFFGKVQVHQNHFHPKNFFHQNPLSAKTTFSKNHFHQKLLSSKTNFIKKPLSSKNQFHQKPVSSKSSFIRKNETKGWTKHGLCPPFGFQQAFMWSIAGRRPAMLT